MTSQDDLYSLLPAGIIITVLVELPGAVARLVLELDGPLALVALALLVGVPAPPDAAELLPDDKVVAARLHLLISGYFTSGFYCIGYLTESNMISLPNT